MLKCTLFHSDQESPGRKLQSLLRACSADKRLKIGRKRESNATVASDRTGLIRCDKIAKIARTRDEIRQMCCSLQVRLGQELPKYQKIPQEFSENTRSSEIVQSQFFLFISINRSRPVICTINSRFSAIKTIGTDFRNSVVIDSPPHSIILDYPPTFVWSPRWRIIER